MSIKLYPQISFIEKHKHFLYISKQQITHKIVLVLVFIILILATGQSFA